MADTSNNSVIEELTANIKPEPAVPSRTVTVPEAGQILGISRHSAYQAVWRGELPVIRIGRRLFVPIAKLNQMLGEDVSPGSEAA